MATVCARLQSPGRTHSPATLVAHSLAFAALLVSAIMALGGATWTSRHGQGSIWAQWSIIASRA